MPIEPEAELFAIAECQRGNRYPLLALLNPLSSTLSFFLCRAHEGKKPLPSMRGNLIGSHVQFLLHQRLCEKKIIEGELAVHYKCKETYVRRCHEDVLKRAKAWQKTLDETRSKYPL